MKKRLLFLTFGLVLSIVSCTDNSSSKNDLGNTSSGETSSEVPSSVISSESEAMAAFNKFQQETNLVINIQNASGLGIVRKKNKTPKYSNGNDGEKVEITNLLVKSTTEYNQNDIVADKEGNVEVSFTKTVTTTTSYTATKEKQLIAYIDEDEKIGTSIDIYGEDFVTFESDTQHMYRAIENEEVVVDWTVGQEETTTFENISNPENIVIENKSLNAKISYPAVEGATYSLYDESNNQIIEEFVSTDEVNVSSSEELIVIDGLIEGNKYTLKYTSNVEEEEINQSKLGGEVDKLYVYNERFTFISFVPYGCSDRPSDESMKYDDDGVSNYDKTDYYTSDDRVSFIVDNNSGYVYKIEDINIAYIYNNLLVTNEFDFVYDFYIDENNDLKIYALYTNKDIAFLDFGKDIYGNKFVSNTKLNYYDENTNTTYFVNRDSQALLKIYTKGECYDPDGMSDEIREVYFGLVHSKNIDRNESAIREDVYLYTSNKRILHTKAGDGDHPSYYYEFFYLLEENSKDVKISPTDHFYVDPYLHGPNCETGILVDDNHVYSINYGVRSYIDLSNFTTIVEYNVDTMEMNRYQSSNEMNYDFKRASYKYFIKHKVVILFDNQDGSVYLDKYFIDGTKEKLLENVNLSNDMKSILKYGVNGNEYYEIVVKENNDQIEAKAYLVGTYKEDPIVITIQPIRR